MDWVGYLLVSVWLTTVLEQLLGVNFELNIHPPSPLSVCFSLVVKMGLIEYLSTSSYFCVREGADQLAVVCENHSDQLNVV